MYPIAMSEDGYRGGPTIEGRLGCAACFVVGAPVFMFLLLAETLGDCAPDIACKKGLLTQVLLPSIVIAIGVGLLVWWVVKIARRNKS